MYVSKARINIPNANINPIASATVMRPPFEATPESEYLYHRRQLLSRNRDKPPLLEYHRFATVLNFLLLTLYHIFRYISMGRNNFFSLTYIVIKAAITATLNLVCNFCILMLYFSYNKARRYCKSHCKNVSSRPVKDGSKANRYKKVT